MAVVNQLEHETWMRLAHREAVRAFDVGEVPIGAVLVYDGQVRRGLDLNRGLGPPLPSILKPSLFIARLSSQVPASGGVFGWLLVPWERGKVANATLAIDAGAGGVVHAVVTIGGRAESVSLDLGD